MKIASAEEIEVLKELNRVLVELLRQLRGIAVNINQIARKMNSGDFIPRGDYLAEMNKNISQYRKESEEIWQLIRRLISGQIPTEQ